MVMFRVYNYASLGNITTDRLGLASTIIFNAPLRADGSKRLMAGGLVALV